MTKTDELKGRIICQGWYYLNGVKVCPHSPCINTGGYECGMNLTDNYMKTDELISKIPLILSKKEVLELEALRRLKEDSNAFMSNERRDRLLELSLREFGFNMGYDNPYGNLYLTPDGKVLQGKFFRGEFDVSQLKEQIKKEENINDFTIPYLKSEYNQQLERITKIIGKKPDIFEQGINALLYIIENKVNPDVMPDTCCEKHEEDVIGFDVIKQHNKKCFDDTLENIKKSMKDKEQPLKSTEEVPDLSKATEEQKRDSIKKVAELASETLLKVFIAFDLKNNIETMIINDATKKEYVLTFETVDRFKERFYQPVKDITDEEMREYVITELKSHVVHPNPLTPSEMNVLNLCCNYIKNHGKI